MSELGKQRKIEKSALIISALVNLVMAGAGLWVFAATKIQALFLDGVFSFIGFSSNLFAVLISKRSKKKTQSYPDGRYFLEPLYAVLKCILLLILMVISVAVTAISAYNYFAHGLGDPMDTRPILPYTVLMVILCFGLGLFNRSRNKRVNRSSTILTAESKANFVDGILSAGVGVGILLLYWIDQDGVLGFLHYTGDFFITTILVAVSLKEPIKVFVHSFKELSGATLLDCEIKRVIEREVAEIIQSVIAYERCDVFKVGMHLKIYISLGRNVDPLEWATLEVARESVLQNVRQIHENIELKYQF